MPSRVPAPNIEKKKKQKTRIVVEIASLVHQILLFIN
jgi:hypothetical protein